MTTKRNHRNNPADSIHLWNLLYPLDRWYRNKYKIRFGSKEHRNTEPISVRLEFEEDKLFANINNSKDQKPYEPSIGDYLNKNQLSQEKIDDIYDNLDIESIKENQDGSIEI